MKRENERSDFVKRDCYDGSFQCEFCSSMDECIVFNTKLPGIRKKNWEEGKVSGCVWWETLWQEMRRQRGCECFLWSDKVFSMADVWVAQVTGEVEIDCLKKIIGERKTNISQDIKLLINVWEVFAKFFRWTYWSGLSQCLQKVFVRELKGNIWSLLVFMVCKPTT